MQHIKFRSIERFEHIVKHVNKRYFPKPVLIFKGSVKLHGTNIGICYNNRDGLWVQSREHILSEKSDNAGSYKFVMERKEAFEKMMVDISNGWSIDLDKNTISLYGEFCGKGIQKNVGISQIEKSIFLFSVKTSEIDNPEDCEYHPLGIPFSHDDKSSTGINDVYLISQFQMYCLQIDFNDIDTSLIDCFTNEVEAECPIAKRFGIEKSLGEGIVWWGYHEGEQLAFKTKGEKHSMKIKKIFVQSEEQKLAESVAHQIVTPARLEQMYDETFDTLNGGKGDIKRLGEFIKAVVKDIEKEEKLTLEEAGLELKQVTKPISQIAKVYFFGRINHDDLKA